MDVITRMKSIKYEATIGSEVGYISNLDYDKPMKDLIQKFNSLLNIYCKKRNISYLSFNVYESKILVAGYGNNGYTGENTITVETHSNPYLDNRTLKEFENDVMDFFIFLTKELKQTTITVSRSDIKLDYIVNKKDGDEIEN